MKILDCTLRDGGYYTNWDYDDKIIEAYITSTNVLPIDYIEIGYRNIISKEYLGKLGYSPVFFLKKIRQHSTKKIAIMLNEKNTSVEDLEQLLDPIIGLVDMVRIAIDPVNFDRAINLAKFVKKRGFEIAFNVMYMSKWNENPEFLSKLSKINGVSDLFCMVDSYGGIMPEELKQIYKIVRRNVNCSIGFHGHNNLQMGLINTLTALDCGVDFVDATILGMGRGAGNLNMELLLAYLAKHGMNVDLNVLGDVITKFMPLYDKYHWGTSLPYMISGANSIPQKEVMEWVSNRTYSFNSIVRALDNIRNNVVDNAKYPVLHGASSKKVLVIGGGNSVIEHLLAIREYIAKNPDMSLIFVTSRHASLFLDCLNSKFYCLVGNEAKRMVTNVSEEWYHDECILSPYPRKMGTEVPSYANETTYELSKITFTKCYLDSCTAVALQTTIELNASSIFIVGYDGYRSEILSEKEMDLSNENRTLFEDYIKYSGNVLVSLLPSLYTSLSIQSIYSLL